MTQSTPSNAATTPPSAPAPEYPPADQSLQAARRLIGPLTGRVRVKRRFVSVGVPTWHIHGELLAKAGPDYEFEIEGDRLEEVAFTLVDTLQTLGFEVGERE